jgi:hypothetical protein
MGSVRRPDCYPFGFNLDSDRRNSMRLCCVVKHAMLYAVEVNIFAHLNPMAQRRKTRRLSCPATATLKAEDMSVSGFEVA